MCGTRPFFGGSGCRVGAHTCPVFPKMPTAPSAFLRRRAIPLPEGGKRVGEGPLKPKEISRYRDTLGQIRAADNTAGRSATRQLEKFRPRLICDIWWPPHSTRPFFWWVQALGRSPHAPSIFKNAYDPVGIPLIRGASGAGQWTPYEGDKSLGEGSLRPKEISRYLNTRPEPYPATGEVQTDTDPPLWQRNLSVLITVRRVHYGEVGNAPITITKLFKKI